MGFTVIKISRRRNGFSLIELLVVMAIVSILMGLLLPAVQKVRESASAIRCRNQMKQMGLAFQSFHDVNNCFPTGGSNPWAVVIPNASPQFQTVGWAYQILPYIEQDNVYRLTDQNQIGSTLMPIYSCPSRRPATITQANGRCGLDYAGVVPNDFWGGSINPAPFYAVNWGIISRSRTANWRVTIPMVLDGLSNTLMIAEKRLDPRSYTSGNWDDDAGWSEGWDTDTMRSTLYPPLQDGIRPNYYPPGGYEFGGVHPSGMHSLFGDGSVRRIRYGLDPAMLTTLGHRSDGQITPDFE